MTLPKTGRLYQKTGNFDLDCAIVLLGMFGGLPRSDSGTMGHRAQLEPTDTAEGPPKSGSRLMEVFLRAIWFGCMEQRGTC
jgi:hypothetical protein